MHDRPLQYNTVCLLEFRVRWGRHFRSLLSLLKVTQAKLQSAKLDVPNIRDKIYKIF